MTGRKVKETEGGRGSGRFAWEVARNMEHGAVPDPEGDRTFLTLVHRAAAAEVAEALEALGDFAARRGALVEAYYWKSRAARRGSETAKRALGALCRVWAESGCRKGEVTEGFELRQAALTWREMCDGAGLDPATAETRSRAR